jgi:phytoene dehydrogenase-like protein
MATSRDDIIVVVGAGHNGLVAAAYLAKAGRKVLVVEQRSIVGGAAATEELHPGFKYSTCADVCRSFDPELFVDLELERHGAKILPLDPVLSVPAPGGGFLSLWQDEGRTKREIERFSKSDAERYSSFAALVRNLAGFLRPLYLKAPPDLKEFKLSGLISLLDLGWKYKGLGKSVRRELLRVLPLSIADFLDEWFETDALKAAVGGTALLGNFLAPRSQGTALLLLGQHLHATKSLFRCWGMPQGGMGSLSNALAQCARRFGATIRTDAKVGRILVKNDCVTGVRLENGEEINAGVVVSAISVNRTFLGLVEPTFLEPDFLLHARNIRSHGTAAKMNLALSELPRWDTGDRGVEICRGIVQIGASLDDIERAYDDAKYGGYSENPWLQVFIPSATDPTVAPAGRHVASVLMQFAPYHLKTGSWAEKRDELSKLVIDTITTYAPNFRNSILHCQTLTPLDLEAIYGLPEGHYHHADLALDQLFLMRPIPGWARYHTPIQGLYLCGAGTHPGGGVSGLPGANSAAEILADLRTR